MESIRAKKLGTDLFFFHIKYNHSDEVLNMLRRHEVDINDTDINGFTALHVAVDLNQVSFVRLLLSNGANPNIPSTLEVGFNTPLHTAAGKGYTEIIEMLLKTGVDINARNQLGQTALHLAARQRHIPLVKMLLAAGADATIRDTNGCNASFYVRGVQELAADLPPPESWKAEEIYDNAKFIRAVLGSSKKKKSKKDGKKGGKKKK